MNKYIKINSNLYLVQQKLKQEKVITKREPVNHIYIYL